MAAQDAPAPFVALGLHEWLARSCVHMGMRTPMPIQRTCVPAVLAGRDVIGRAATGSGKTAAFALPILQRLSEDPYGVYALVLTPTRELAAQINEQFVALGERMSVRTEVVVGGVDMVRQAAALQERPHVVIGTPGRLLDHLRSAHAEHSPVFRRLAVLVLDEADRLLDLGFGAEIGALLELLPPCGARQTLLFSATITRSLRELQALALRKPFVADAREPALGPSAGAAGAEADGAAARGGGAQRAPEEEEGAVRELDGVSLPEGLAQFHLFVPLKVKDVYLAFLVRRLLETPVSAAGARVGGGGAAAAAAASIIIFTSTCLSCELLARTLSELGVQCASLHSLHLQRSRLAALQRFRSHRVRVLVATDIAARGLDVPSVGCVLNYNVPAMPADYVHRVGRTARAGRRGTAITLVSQYEVERFLAIEAVVGRRVPSLDAEEAEAAAGQQGGAGADDAAGAPPGLQVREKSVLKLLNEVSGARRAAMMELTESGFVARAQKRKKQREAQHGGQSAGQPRGAGRAEDAEHALAAEARAPTGGSAAHRRSTPAGAAAAGHKRSRADGNDGGAAADMASGHASPSSRAAASADRPPGRKAASTSQAHPKSDSEPKPWNKGSARLKKRPIKKKQKAE